MNLLPAILVCCVLPFASRAAEGEALDDALSPDGTMIVVNVQDKGAGDHFEIRDRAGQTLFSEEAMRPYYYEYQAQGAEKVLWRADSQYVAIAFSTTYLGKDTAIFRLVNGKLEQYGVRVDAYDPKQDQAGKGDTKQRMPDKWKENGNLTLDIASGYEAGSRGKITHKPCVIVCPIARRKLDEDPRAELPNHGQTSSASSSQFRTWQKAYDPATFDQWKKKLALVHEGMDLREVGQVVGARKVTPHIGMGGGVITTIELDDAYYADVLISGTDSKVLSAPTSPIAYTYEIFPDPPP